MMSNNSPPSRTPEWQVICLCAEWCGTCRDWRAQLRQVAVAHPEARIAWVDIEDHADVVGDVDIETFPTLLVARNGRVRFMGPVLPHAAQVGRLLATLEADERAGNAPPEAVSLLQRLDAAELDLI